MITLDASILSYFFTNPSTRFMTISESASLVPLISRTAALDSHISFLVKGSGPRLATRTYFNKKFL